MAEYNLQRFIDAQKYDYNLAFSELREGYKNSHWMWYIFPQLKGLGFSEMSEYYGIDGIGEAKAYIENDVLRERLLSLSDLLLTNSSSDPRWVMGYPDDLKLQSSMTLFALVAPEHDVFQKVLDKFFDGRMDEKTVRMVRWCEERRGEMGPDGDRKPSAETDPNDISVKRIGFSEDIMPILPSIDEFNDIDTGMPGGEELTL